MRLLLIALLLSGCTSLTYDDRFSLDKLKRTEFSAKIIYEDVPTFGKARPFGHYKCVGNDCVMVLKKGYGNACLLHEILHFMYGNWHKGQKYNSEFCN